MRLEDLFVRLRDDPSAMSEIEKEVQMCIGSPDLTPAKDLMNSAIPEIKFYALKIVEERIRGKKMAGITPEEEMSFMSGVVQATNTDKAAQVFALLGIYEWPSSFPQFFSIIIDLLSHRKEVGYKILENFLYLCNYSQEINEERKDELKRGCAVMSHAYMPLFDDSMAEYIIPILTESLKMMPRTFDCSIVLRRGSEFPDKTIEFLNDGMDMLDIESVIDLASRMDISYGMIMCFNNLKDKTPQVRNVKKMYEYVFKGLRKDLITFSASIEFWTKLFSRGGMEEIVGEVQTEVVSIYLSIDERQRTEIEGEVFGLFNVICRNYPGTVINFISVNGDCIGRKLALYFLKKLFGSSSSGIPSDLTFRDPILRCSLAIYKKDPSAVDHIQYFDLNEKESCRLVIRILEMFPLSAPQLEHILSRCNVSDKTYANEVIVECFTRLGRGEEFTEKWTHDEIIRFFFYLKKQPEKFRRFSGTYYRTFLERAPFDRCFAILRMLGDIPEEILRKIYSDIDSYPVADVSCFNRDLLCYLENQSPFIQKEITRLVNEWRVSEDPGDLVACVKSLVHVIANASGLSGEQKFCPYVNELIEILQIDEPTVVKKVSETFNAHSGPFDTHRAVYLFMVSYNSGALENAHSSIISSLTICIKQENGPKAFSETLGIDQSSCINLREDVLKSQTRRAQSLVRAFLQSYKGKPLNSLYANDFKVKGQNFLEKIPSRKEVEFEIERSFFEDGVQ
ncbi:transportin-3 [Encephalitozoon hellem]|uniref:Transportin-3 n=1 Tax=Encephalitozoon hellem TaxID=27973 RepID=A0ABY8CI91_ENCHE|nr:transportin-3 [Encephalitozoon hellem]